MTAVAATVPFRAAIAQPAPLRFDFQSAFWENLHHRLYFQAQAFESVKRGDKLDPRGGVWDATAAKAYAEYRALSPEQRLVWERAMQLYIDHRYADSDLLEDFMASIDAALARLGDGAQPVAGDDLRAGIVEALTVAAPVYRTTQWEEDDRTNRAWIAMVSPLVDAHSATLTARLGAWYAMPWPVGPYRVDVTRYANWAGCYTNTDPVHIIISSGDFRNNVTLAPVANVGKTALEMVFHEASHTVVTPGYATVGTAIENAAAALGKREPDGLWHAVIFYTAGRAVVDAFAGEPYEMFADAVDVYRHAWKPYREALVDHWQPYLDGRGTLSVALHDVVAAVYQAK